MGVVKNDEEEEAGDPSQRRFPFEPVKDFWEFAWIDLPLFDLVIEPAVDHEDFAFDISARGFRWLEAAIHPNEVEGAADPRDSRNEVGESKKVFNPEM